SFSCIGHDLLGIIWMTCDLLSASGDMEDYLDFDHEGGHTFAIFDLKGRNLTFSLYPDGHFDYHGDNEGLIEKTGQMNQLETIKFVNKVGFQAKIELKEYALLVYK